MTGAATRDVHAVVVNDSTAVVIGAFIIAVFTTHASAGFRPNRRLIVLRMRSKGINRS